MKKVFIIHGLESSPNGGWRGWLMVELSKLRIYACALSMPDPAEPQRAEWVGEIARHVERNEGDEIYLVGHSLGVPAILRYLESASGNHAISGAVLVSGRCEKTDNAKLAHFFEEPFDFKKIASMVPKVAVIHGDDDPVVPLQNAHILSSGLLGELIIIPKGGHLNGSGGWHTLPQCLDALKKMMA